jgi:hypothetical protein
MTLVALPTLLVDAGFSLGASTSTYLTLDDAARGKLNTATLGPDEVWTDISPYLHGTASITRGSQRVGAPIVRYDPGTASVVLNNLDRRFDRNNLDGPYVAAGISQVTPMRALRIRAVWDSVTYNLWRGFADDWPLDYIGPEDAIATFIGTDATKVLQGKSRGAVAPVGGGETSAARIARILDSAGWSATDRLISAGGVTVQETTLEGGVLDELQLVGDTEIGEVYIDGAGRVVFRTRTALITDTRSNISQATFGDGPGELPYESVKVSTDDATFYNEIRITRVGGTEQVVSDTASTTLNLAKTYPRDDLIYTTDADARTAATWLLGISKNPEIRFDQLVLDSVNDPAGLLPHMLGREIGDRITIIKRPAVGPPIQQDEWIRGINHEIGADSWRTTWTLQSSTKSLHFMTLDDATAGQLDSTALG